MEKIHTIIHNMFLKAHACFHVFSPFRAHFTPHYIITDKGLLGIILLVYSASFTLHLYFDKSFDKRGVHVLDEVKKG